MRLLQHRNKRVAQLIANKILIENNIGIFQIPIERLEIGLPQSHWL